MAKMSFGEPVEQDILVIQGIEYRLEPFGMAAFKASIERAEKVDQIRESDDQAARLTGTYDLSVDLIVNAVHPDDRERLMEHLDRSIPPTMVSNIAAAIMRGISDVDPTPPTSSSDGSSETGPGSMDGALPGV